VKTAADGPQTPQVCGDPKIVNTPRMTNVASQDRNGRWNSIAKKVSPEEIYW
jgi:hypothetical protein